MAPMKNYLEIIKLIVSNCVIYIYGLFMLLNIVR